MRHRSSCMAGSSTPAARSCPTRACSTGSASRATSACHHHESPRPDRLARRKVLPRSPRRWARPAALASTSSIEPVVAHSARLSGAAFLGLKNGLSLTGRDESYPENTGRSQFHLCRSGTKLIEFPEKKVTASIRCGWDCCLARLQRECPMLLGYTNLRYPR